MLTKTQKQLHTGLQEISPFLNLAGQGKQGIVI
jgi:hypothetical protein